MIVVVGSGPAGIASAKALRAQGFEVTLLDAGVTLEPERQTLVDRLAQTGPEDWPEDVLAEIRRQTPPELGGVPLKFTFGSDFPYREVERMVPFSNSGSATRPTLARGGFSTVWGSAALPYPSEDMAGWPITAEDLAPHYRAVTQWMPLSAVADDLQAELPLHCDRPRPLQPSGQAHALMRDLDRARRRLQKHGIRHGWSRLAVRAEPNARGRGCTYCGMCMYGCPYGLIYDSAATLAELLEDPGFHYIGGVVVEHLEESGDRVEIRGRNLETGDPRSFSAERVYLGCGVISTTRLLLSSLDAYDRPLDIRDSQYFLVPLLRLRSAGNPQHEAVHTLAQIFLELRDPEIARHSVHLQLYGYNDLYKALFDRMLGPLATAARPAVNTFLARLWIVQGYLHSEISPTIRAALRRTPSGSLLELTQRANPETRPSLRRVMRRLLRHSLDLRAVALWPALQVSPPGRGFHSGGSFPMREHPAEFESDVLGRPHGFSRVHIVDSSTFPSIPATTITLTVMANAHRIASAHGEL